METFGYYGYIHESFTNSPYGQALEQNIRFGDFKPDYISNNLWENLLGDDVNNLRHMPHTFEIASEFIQRQRKIGGELLKLTAITHDWGEAVVGDVALPDKEAQGHDQAEIDAYKHIAWKLLGQEGRKLDEAAEVIWGQHELSEPFNCIEYIGYCQTGLRAGKMACLLANGVIRPPELSRRHLDGLVGGLLSLNKMVEIKNYPKLAKYAEKYPFIGEML